MEWLSSHSAAITALTSLLTLLVWLFYAQLLYLNFRRQRQPKIIINRGGGKSLKTRCVISNMSSEPIFIEHIIAILHTDAGKYSAGLIDLDDPEASENDHLGDITRQGPMSSGSFNHIGTFEDIIGRIAKFHGLATEKGWMPSDMTLETIELRLVAIYGSEDAPVGALRRFELLTDDTGCYLTPTTLDTRRYASMLRRRNVRQWIREMND